jgi:hypothetical protein
MNMRKSLLVGATVATVALGGGGIALAATDTSNSGGNTLTDKIAARFNLDKKEVQAVVNEHREERHEQREQEHKESLAEAVKAGTLTQAQADHITKVHEEIEALKGDKTHRELSDEVRDQIRDKHTELRDWAEEQGIELHEVMGGGEMHGRGMHFGQSDNS